MVEKPIKLNKLGKPIHRKPNGDFAPGNQEGKIFGKDQKAPGRPKGSLNLMTYIKEVALAKSAADGKTNIEFIAATMVDSARDMEKMINRLKEKNPDDPKIMVYKEKIAYLSARIMEQLAKYSGDYTAKFQAEISDQLSDDEKEMMEKALKANAK
jgi:hypothetical protein